MSKLNKSRVLELIQSYGANPKRWPKAEQRAGEAWLEDNPVAAEKILAEANALDQILDTASAFANDTALLQARILKASENIPQDGVATLQAANDASPTILSSWKAVAATLVLATGMGFGIGQVAAADTSYDSAEALLSLSMQSDYAEADLFGEG